MELFVDTTCLYIYRNSLQRPSSQDESMEVALSKMEWAAIAVFAPEIVLHTASVQFLDARKVIREVNEMRGQIRGKKR